MDLAIDKHPFLLNMTVYEAASTIEALATKCTKAQREADEFRYENASLSEKVRDIDSRLSCIERTVNQEEGK